MKAISLVIMTLILPGVLTGCAGNREIIRTMGTSASQNVFQVIEGNMLPVSGYVDLRIFSSLKTHKPGIYSDKDLHGTPNYTILVNIDGQAVTLQGSLMEERRDAISMRDPNEGVGIRYQFEKIVRIKSGAHKVAVAIPADDLVIERDILLPENGDSSLVVEPVYGDLPGKKRLGLYGATSFKEGVKQLKLSLNGKDI